MAVSLNSGSMKWSLYALGLSASLLAGVILQKYFNVSGYIGEGLRAVGLYGYVYGQTQALQNAASTEVIPSTSQGQLRLFVLMGQSNMSGLAPLLDAQSKTQNIYTFGNDYRWAVSVEPVDSALAQVDTVSLDPEAGFGPSVAFAEALQSQGVVAAGESIGLIPCAKGGSSIAQWQRNLSDQSLYGSCLKRIRAAATMGQVEGILFFQGEADAIDPKLYPSLAPQAHQWAAQFTQFATALREDLQRSTLPIVYAQIGSLPSQDVPENKMFVNWETVRQQQAQVQLPHSARIQTDDLTTIDGVHFTAESYQAIGQRFAAAWASITP